MDELRIWVMTLCVCAAVINIADELMPDGGVKKTACFVLSLIAASCLLSPIKSISDFKFDDIGIPQTVNTDWFSRETSSEFAKNTVSIIREELSKSGITAENITVCTDIDSDGSIYIDKARITIDERYAERIPDIESLLYERLKIETDVVLIGN